MKLDRQKDLYRHRNDPHHRNHPSHRNNPYHRNDIYSQSNWCRHKFLEPWLKWTWTLLSTLNSSFIHANTILNRKLLPSNKSTLRKIISYAKDDICTHKMITRYAEQCINENRKKTYLFCSSSPDPLVMMSKAARNRKIIVNYRIILMMLMIWDDSLELTLQRRNLTNTSHYSNKDYNTGLSR